MRDTTVNGLARLPGSTTLHRDGLSPGALPLVLPDGSKIGATLAVIWDRGMASSF
jgi:hypothetical protein